jgi:hypothetical protein
MKGIIKQSMVLACLISLSMMQNSYADSVVSTGPASPDNSSNSLNSPYISNQSPGYGGLNTVPSPPPPPPPQIPSQPNPKDTFQSKTGITYDIKTLQPVKTLFPAGCEAKGFAMQDKNLLLADGYPPFHQSLFLLLNLTAFDIVINHVDDSQAGASAGWFSKLKSNHWSAVAIDQADFSLNCLTLQPMSFAYVPCDKVLKICSFPDTEESGGTAGSYWVAENISSLSDILGAIKARGFTLPAQPPAAPVVTTPTSNQSAPSANQYHAWQPPKPVKPTTPPEEEPNQSILAPVTP